MIVFKKMKKNKMFLPNEKYFAVSSLQTQGNILLFHFHVKMGERLPISWGADLLRKAAT